MKKYFAHPIAFFVLGCLLSLFGVAIAYGTFLPKAPEFKPNTNASDSFQTLKITPPIFPKEANFAGEKVPLELVDIRERYDRELLINTYFQGSNLYNMKLTARWFPVIEPILKKNGIPDDFKYLCLAESALQQVVSKSNAVGFWQFLAETGKRNGLEINDEVDERYNVELATEAACKYFIAADSIFHNWTLVAASYNCGTNGVSKFMENQQQSNYYDLYLPDETMRYVFRILALKEIFQHPRRYGFILEPTDYYPAINYQTITVSDPIPDFANFAIEHGTTYKMLKVYNPWLRSKQLKNTKHKSYDIKLPA